MSDPVQIPAWLKEKVVDKFNSGVSQVFVLHFNVGDYFAVQDRFLTLQEMLLELTSQREVVTTYQYPSGLSFAQPEMETRFRRLAAISSRDPLPAGAHQNLQLLDRLLKNEALPPRQIGIIIPFAESLFPAGSNYSTEEKANIITLLRWAGDRTVAARKPIIFLITSNIKDIAHQILSSSQGIEQVQVPKPDVQDRRLYIDFLIAHNPALKMNLTAEEFAHHTQGLSLNQVEDIVLRSLSEGTSIDTDSVLARKVEILEQEYGQVLEIDPAAIRSGSCGWAQLRGQRIARNCRHHEERPHERRADGNHPDGTSRDRQELSRGMFCARMRAALCSIQADSRNVRWRIGTKPGARVCGDSRAGARRGDD